MNEILAELKKCRQHKKKCIYFGAKDNIIVKNKKLCCLDELMKNEKYKDLYVCVNNNKTGISLWSDFGFISWQIISYVDFSMISSLDNYLINPIKSYSEFKEYLKNIHKGNKYINMLNIEVLKMGGDIELADEYKIYRDNFLKKKEEERQAQIREQEIKKEKILEKRKKELNNSILEAENRLLNKQGIDNINIDVYYSAYEYKTTSLVLYLMKKNCIDVPLRTQGWIRKSLLEVNFEVDGRLSYSYIGRKSKVIFEYLDLLLASIEKNKKAVNENE